jgi:uncharacterized membrane protein YeaQ/YmgE (transglycosylase-associated protein family)
VKNIHRIVKTLPFKQEGNKLLLDKTKVLPDEGGVHMQALSLVLADGITIQVGSYVVRFGLDFLIYLLIAGIVGLIAEYIVGWRVPLGIIGAIIAALVGMWLITTVIPITVVGDFVFYGVPLIRALIGAILFVVLWHLLTYGLTRRRYHAV